MKKTKTVGDKLHPCLTPQFLGNIDPGIGLNEYYYDMVSVHVLVRVLNANLCKEVTGGLFHFILFCILIICMKCLIFFQGGGG